MEEAQNVSHASWQNLIPTMRKEGSEIWMSFNPTTETLQCASASYLALRLAPCSRKWAGGITAALQGSEEGST
jgi:hypothetical protein